MISRLLYAYHDLHHCIHILHDQSTHYVHNHTLAAITLSVAKTIY